MELKGVEVLLQLREVEELHNVLDAERLFHKVGERLLDEEAGDVQNFGEELREFLDCTQPTHLLLHELGETRKSVIAFF